MMVESLHNMTSEMFTANTSLDLLISFANKVAEHSSNLARVFWFIGATLDFEPRIEIRISPFTLKDLV
jgi:hypothetical protein